jgi:hypothetical protein
MLISKVNKEIMNTKPLSPHPLLALAIQYNSSPRKPFGGVKSAGKSDCE